MSKSTSRPRMQMLVRRTVYTSHFTHSLSPVLAALKPAYEGVIGEPENTFFEVFQNPANPGEFRFVEHWNASVEWFMNVCRFERPMGVGNTNDRIGTVEEGILWAVSCGDGAVVGQAEDV